MRWRNDTPGNGQRARVWYFSETVVATWHGRHWVTDSGHLLPGWAVVGTVTRNAGVTLHGRYVGVAGEKLSGFSELKKGIILRTFSILKTCVVFTTFFRTVRSCKNRRIFSPVPCVYLHRWLNMSSAGAGHLGARIRLDDTDSLHKPVGVYGAKSGAASPV